MITPRGVSIALAMLACSPAGAELAAGNILFRKASRNYDETGELGRARTREFETRMFTQRTWRQRLYCSGDHATDVNDTLEVYAKPDGSGWLAFRHATPSLSREINRRYFVHDQFDLKKSLDSLRITGGDIRLPPTVANEIEALWQVMLPGLDREPQSKTRIIIVNAPMFIGFRREGPWVVAGTIANAAYGTRAYREFVDIVDDLIYLCRSSGKARNALLARLPQRMEKLRGRLSKSSNQAMQRTAGRSAFPLSVTSIFNRQRRALSPAVADLVSR
jgi:hypothetical protein